VSIPKEDSGCQKEHSDGSPWYTRNNVSRPYILVCGIVHDLVLQVSIYMTKYRNVIGFDVPQTPKQSATSYSIHLDMAGKVQEQNRQYFSIFRLEWSCGRTMKGI
jgi:hypothetical protein